MSLRVEMGDIIRSVERSTPMHLSGRVVDIVGTVIEGHVPDAAIGALCEIHPGGEADPVTAQVVGFRGDRVLFMPHHEMHGLRAGARISLHQADPTISTGEHMLGRVIDAFGNPLDGGPPLSGGAPRSIFSPPVPAMDRPRITQPLDVGVRAINSLLTIGQGQRMAIMAGSGVGKSVLLGMTAKHTAADVSVIALVGERGREVREFIERDLGEEGLRRSVVIVATSDTSPLLRVRASFVATAVAEHFRDEGRQVLLMMDSITRLAMAQREVGLAIGEPPTSKGYTPSVLSLLPRLLERCGTSPNGGTITGLITVLVEGDDLNDPVADTVRSIVDGHIVLSRELAAQNHYPAIDVLGSKSRVMNDVCHASHMENVRQVLEWLATYRRIETLLNIGAYTRGTNPQIDQAVAVWPRIMVFLRQLMDEHVSLAESQAQLAQLVRSAANPGA